MSSEDLMIYSAHMTEETTGAERSGPLGIVTAVATTAVFGWFYTLSLLFSVQVLACSFSFAYSQTHLQSCHLSPVEFVATKFCRREARQRTDRWAGSSIIDLVAADQNSSQLESM